MGADPDAGLGQPRRLALERAGRIHHHLRRQRGQARREVGRGQVQRDGFERGVRGRLQAGRQLPRPGDIAPSQQQPQPGLHRQALGQAAAEESGGANDQDTLHAELSEFAPRGLHQA